LCVLIELNNKKIKIRKNIMTEFGSQENNQFIPQIEHKDEIVEGANDALVPQDLSESIGTGPSSVEAVFNIGQDAVEKLGELGAETALSPEMAPQKELNEIQKQNEIVTKELLKHFPKAFIEGTTKDGRTYGILKDPLNDDQTTPLNFHKVISPNGIVEFGLRSFDGSDYQSGRIDTSRLITITRCLDFAPILDSDTDASGRTSSIDINTPEGEEQHSLSAMLRRRVDFADPYLDLAALNKLFRSSQEKHESDPIPNELDTNGIIAALTMSANEAQFN
jgi:hypothetical protein